MRLTRYLLLFLAIYFVFIGGSSRYLISYQVRVAHHIIVTLLLVLWLIGRIRGKSGIPSTTFNIPLFALIGVWFFSAITSLDPRMAFEHIWFPFTYIAMFFVIVDYFQRGRSKLIMEVFFFVMVIVIMLTVLEYISWYLGMGILPNTSIPWANLDILPTSIPPATLAMSISTLVAGFTAPCIFITATWALTVRRKAHKQILWIVALGLLATLLLTFSRGGLLALIAGLTTFSIIRLLQHPKITQYISPKIIGGLGGSLALLIMGLFVITTLPYAIGRSDEGRLDMWQSAVRMTLDDPITGVGPGLFGRAYRDYRDPIPGRDKLAAAHNLYLNIASELGVPGILVGIWLTFVLFRGSYHTWQHAKGRNQHLRVEGLVAALVALAVHSSVDVFTITPINLVFIIIVAYLVTGHRSILDPRPDGQLKPTYALLGITLVFGFALIQWDRAQGLYQSSFGAPFDEALQLTKDAQTIDPYLNLYHLHEAFLFGNHADSPEQRVDAIAKYKKVLELEPTWDIGWINLAYLEYQNGQADIALSHLQKARIISPYNSASFAYARIADLENLAEPNSILNAYARGLWLNQSRGLPLSEVWWETDLSTQATEAFLSKQNIEQQYRVLHIYRPEQAQQLISENPTTAQEWWVLGTSQLEQGMIKEAEKSFTQAIENNPDNGSYYVSRAKTSLDNIPQVLDDLQHADVYGTRYEYPNRVRALIAETPEEAFALKFSALPLRQVGQEFSIVLYTRPAIFDVPPMMRLPGLGESDLVPWYDIAEAYENQDDTEGAIRAYTFILSQAPYESRAQNQLDQLLGNP